MPIPTLDQDALSRFSNWTGQTDTKVMAHDLMKRGLVGADQLYFDSVDTTSPNSIRKSQSDWKVAAIQNILMNAKKLNLRKPEEIMANRHILIDNPTWKEGINNPAFKQVHPNFWQVISNSILPEQYAKSDKEASLLLAKK